MRPILELWPKESPDGWKRDDQEIEEFDQKNNWKIVKNVSKPTLELFDAAKPAETSPTIIVLPGGGYWIEAIEHEGYEIAERLNSNGIHAAVLKYRLPNRDADKPLHKAPLQDAQRAIRLVRSRGAKRVGIMGFSAGGHLAAATSTARDATYASVDAADQHSFRPSFAGLIYPAYLDSDGKPELPADIQVRQETAPAFIVQTMDDNGLVMSSFSYAMACQRAHVPVELHMYAKGGHGYGIRSKEPGISSWMDLFIEWLRRLP